MSIEENGHKNGEIDEVSAREDAPSGASFDGLARGLATGTVSRRKALRMLAASLFGGVLVAAPAGMALAAPRDKRKPGGTGCGRAGEIRDERGQCVCNEAEGFFTCQAEGENKGTCVNPLACPGDQEFNPATCKCECPAEFGEGAVFCGGQCVAACADTEVLVDCTCVTAVTCAAGTCQTALSTCVPNSDAACGENGGACVNCTTNTNGNTVCGPNGTCVAPPSTTCTAPEILCPGSTTRCGLGADSTCSGNGQCCSGTCDKPRGSSTGTCT